VEKITNITGTASVNVEKKRPYEEIISPKGEWYLVGAERKDGGRTTRDGKDAGICQGNTLTV
jgi:hypothetical protein